MILNQLKMLSNSVGKEINSVISFLTLLDSIQCVTDYYAHLLFSCKPGWWTKFQPILATLGSIHVWHQMFLGYFWPKYLPTRRPVLSTDQAIPSCFFFRISWILMEQRCFYFFCPLGFLEGLRSLKQWLLQKVSMKNLDQKFKFLIKK